MAPRRGTRANLASHSWVLSRQRLARACDKQSVCGCVFAVWSAMEALELRMMFHGTDLQCVQLCFFRRRLARLACNCPSMRAAHQTHDGGLGICSGAARAASKCAVGIVGGLHLPNVSVCVCVCLRFAKGGADFAHACIVGTPALLSCLRSSLYFPYVPQLEAAGGLRETRGG